MIRTEASVDIEGSAAEVWALIGDPRKLADWDPGVKRVVLQDPLQVGSPFTVTAEFLGRDRTSSARIVIFEPGRRIGWHIDPPGGSRLLWGDSRIGAVYSFEPTSTGSRLTRTFEAVGHGPLGRLVAPLVRRRAERERFEEVQNVKRAVEGTSR